MYSVFYRVRDVTTTAVWRHRLRHCPLSSDVGERLDRKTGADKNKKGGATVAKHRVLATVRVQKGHVRAYRDILP